MEAVNAPLRVGVFADRRPQPRWMVEALARAAATPFAEVALVCAAAGPDAGLRPRAGPTLVWDAYRRADRALFGRGLDGSAPVDVAALAPRELHLARDAAGAWRECARERQLDVAFVLGEVADAELDGLARYGTWRFCFGEAGTASDEAHACRREVVTSELVVASAIRIHRGAGLPDRLACRSWARTYPFSFSKTREAMFAKTCDFLTRALRDLRAAGPGWLEEGTVPAGDATRDGLPPTFDQVRDVLAIGGRVARRTLEKALTNEEWSIAFRFAPEAVDDWDGSLDGWHRLDPPQGGYWADPFPLQVGGRHFIFFEELPRGAAKAHISVVEVDRRGRASKATRVLERDYHLSYPFLVEEGGQLYMVPETAHNHTVEVYRCIEFPHRWRRERVLVEGLFCADATLHREGDRWWMFANVGANGDSVNDELHLFGAGRLLGDWKPHRRNPVKSDVRSSRPAGRLFRRAGALYRPGQICAPLYGSGIALHRVERLDDEAYVENEEARIVPRAGRRAPPWGSADRVLGIHTLNRAGELCTTDAFVRRPRFA